MVMGTMKIGRPRRYDLPYSDISESDRRRIQREMRFHAEVNIPGDRTPSLPTPIGLAVLLIVVVLVVGAFREGWFEPAGAALRSAGVSIGVTSGTDQAVSACKATIRRDLGVTRDEQAGDFVTAANGLVESGDTVTWTGWADSGVSSRRFTCAFEKTRQTVRVTLGF
jgi:hypothetical protein